MTRQYSDSIALAAREIVAASAVDITQPVSILPLAKLLQEQTGCSRDTAKRHVAKAIRLARGELINSSTWGGKRTPSGGRLNMKTPKQPTRTLPANAFSVGGFIVFTFGHCSTCGGTFTAYVTTEEWEAGCGAPAWGECSGCGAT